MTEQDSILQGQANERAVAIQQGALAEDWQGNEAGRAYDLETLVVSYAALQARLAEDTDTLGRMAMRIVQAMDAASATVLDHPLYDVEIKRQTKWDRSKLAAIRELVPPDALDGAYIPAHEETFQAPEAWNMTKVKTLAKYGKAVQDVLAAAQYPGAPRLTVKAKGDTNDYTC